MADWHQLFGLALADFFLGTPYTVEVEKELSVKQRLDIVIICKGIGQLQEKVPDGLENLSNHNLLTYKSLRQPLDSWALDELIGHYVNYRKIVSQDEEHLIPFGEFRLYGVSTRYPQKLASAETLKPVIQGVYEVKRGQHVIRVIVLSQITEAPHNALWHLFSGIKELVQYGAASYKWRRKNNRSMLRQLVETYSKEGLIMAYTFEDFYRDFTRDHVHFLTPEERMKGLSPDDILKRFTPDDILKRFTPDDILKRFTPDDIVKRLTPDDRLKGLSMEEIEAYLERVKKLKKS
jgi:hypothetical protein